MLPTSPRTAPFTRRDFIWRVARHGGSAMGALLALDLLARDQGGKLKLEGRAPAAKNNKVVVLGAGVAGLCAAHELRKLGYQVTVLEARPRVGGRCWTVRGGAIETEIGRAAQTCRFDEGHYLNAGPMRIAHHHETTLAYCRELGVALTTFTNVNAAAFVHRAGRGKLRWRELQADMRGHTAELLAKVIKKEQLDRPLSADDRERLLEYLRADGNLDATLRYPRSGDTSEDPTYPEHRRGYDPRPGAAGERGVATVPLDLEALIKSGFGAFAAGDTDFNQQPTMLTPVGGMDRIPHAFAARLDGAIQLGAIVREVRRTSSGGVRVVYTEAANPRAAKDVTADFCVCALPPPILARLPADFSAPTKAALVATQGAAAGKIGLQFKRRFWEEDDEIYGGVTRTDQSIRQIVYPPEGFGGRKGVLIGYYHFGDGKRALDEQPFAERERIALAQGAEIHPQYRTEFENSFSVAWSLVPHSEMAWAGWESGDVFERCLKALGAADGPFYFAGDWLSYLNSWQAGAFASAQRACRELHTRALAS